MKVLISSLNAVTRLDWLGDRPDFAGIEQPTLSILQLAFDAGSYTLQEDDEFVEPELLPDWTSFIAFMDSKKFFEMGYQENFPVFSQLFNMVLRMRDAALPLTEDYVEWRNFKACYQIGVSVFQPFQLQAIEEALLSANVPKFW